MPELTIQIASFDSFHHKYSSFLHLGFAKSSLITIFKIIMLLIKGDNNMILIWNFQSIIIGLLFGIGFSASFFFIAEDLILSMRQDDPNDEFINSEMFKMLMKYIMPIIIIFGSGLIVGPFFTWGYEQTLLQESILGMDPGFFFMISILIFSLVLDFAIFITKTPFPTFKLVANTWMFLTLGLLLHLILK